MQLDAVEARARRPLGCCREAVERLLDLGVAHLLRDAATGELAERDLARPRCVPGRVLVVGRLLARQRERTHPRVHELDPEDGSVAVHLVGDPPERLDVAVVEQLRSEQRRGERVLMDVRPADEDEARFAFRALRVVLGRDVGEDPVERVADPRRTRGGIDDLVLDRRAPHLPRREQPRVQRMGARLRLDSNRHVPPHGPGRRGPGATVTVSTSVRRRARGPVRPMKRPAVTQVGAPRMRIPIRGACRTWSTT
jgi:hypothetical protein